MSMDSRAREVQAMFARIARRYNLMNRLMTAGQDVRWRRMVVALAQLPPGGQLLDLGAGTGDIAFEALHRPPLHPPLVFAADFTLEMMRVGRKRAGGERIHWAGTDALNLPFPDESFDAVTSGFLMRNVVDPDRTLAEQFRVLRPGGRVVCLDTTPPPRSILRPFILMHLRLVIPTLGRLVTGDAAAYRYLPASTEGFVSADALAAKFASAGFREVGYKRLMFGTIVIHWGQK